MRNKIIPYNPILKELARRLRKESTLAEVLLWKKIKGKALGCEFHRQVPLDEYIVDFYCPELLLAIEIDGGSHFGETAFKHDAQRQTRLESFGVRFIRFTEKEVRQDIEQVIKKLSGWIEDSIA